LIDTARDLAHTLYGVFTFPGNVLLAYFSPPEAGYGEILWPVLGISIAYWLAVALVVLRIRAWLAVFGAMLGRLAGDIAFGVEMRMRNLTRAFLKPLRWLRLRSQAAGVEAETIEFDELDMAVLKVAGDQSKGRVVSALELAESLPVRPAQLQESLERLHAFRLLDQAMSATDGYENYRLTPAGARFIRQIG
jgi:hypothetical protein